MGVSSYFVNDNYRICTSSTRPVAPFIYEGLMIYETDTNRTWIYDGSAWFFNSGVTPSCRLQHTGTQALTTNTLSPILFGAGSEIYDTDSFHNTSTNTSRITIPTGLGGLWAFGGDLQFDNSSAGDRAIIVQKNGTTRLVQSEIGALATGLNPMYNVAAEDRLVAGDYIELIAWQSTGGNLAAVGNSAKPMNFWASFRGSV